MLPPARRVLTLAVALATSAAVLTACAPGSPPVTRSVRPPTAAMVGAATSDAVVTTQAASSRSRTRAATRLLGPTRSGLPWHSGVWVGGRFSPSTLRQFAAQRGRSVDIVTTYSERSSFGAIAASSWSIDVWDGFGGTLNYGLSILPDDGAGSLSSIAAGRQDWVWRSVARNLVRAGRGDAVVRIGWEANLDANWRWAANATQARQYRAAFRRVSTVLTRTAPNLKIDFGIACGNGLSGARDRLAPLSKLYPGDSVVDIVSCDVYDWWSTRVRSSDRTPITRPAYGPGLADLAHFARKHHKGVGIGEWGLARRSNGNGGGDNPDFIRAMRTYLQRNTDVVVYECYFDEPASYIRSSIMTRQNPRAARTYRALW